MIYSRSHGSGVAQHCKMSVFCVMYQPYRAISPFRTRDDAALTALVTCGPETSLTYSRTPITSTLALPGVTAIKVNTSTL